MIRVRYNSEMMDGRIALGKEFVHGTATIDTKTNTLDGKTLFSFHITKDQVTIKIEPEETVPVIVIDARA